MSMRQQREINILNQTVAMLTERVGELEHRITELAEQKAQAPQTPKRGRPRKESNAATV